MTEPQWDDVVGSATPARGKRAPLAQHHRFAKRSATGRLVGIISASLAAVLIAGVGVVATVAGSWLSTLQNNSIDLAGVGESVPSISELKGGANILLMGVDACEEAIAADFGDRCKNPESDPTLNDVNIVVHISDNPRKVTAITFPRDLIIDSPECLQPDGSTLPAQSGVQINSLYEYGGISCVAQTIESLSGGTLPIQYGAMITWKGVIDITTAIGGVDVCLASPIDDPEASLQLPAGDVHLEGLTALNFLRTRYGLVGGSDLARIGNQQVFMSAMVRKMLSEEVLKNPGTVLKLAQTVFDSITPTKALANPRTLAELAFAVKDVPAGDFTFLRLPVYDHPTQASRVLMIEDDAATLFAAIAANRPLTVTNTGGEYDGAVVNPTSDPTATSEAPEVPTPDGSGTTDPTPTAAPTTPVELPSTVTGFTPADNACTHGAG